jgi:uncharacterized membrane protein YbhN (UPF0104 family)
MDQPQKHHRLGAWLKHLLQLALGLALFGTLLYLGGLESLKLLTHLRLGPLLGAFLATLVIAGAIAGRWGTITNALAGRQLAPSDKYLHYFLLSRSLGFILPKDLTDLGGRAVALNRFHAAPLTLAGASVLYDRLFDVLSVALLLPPSLLYWGNWVSVETAIGLMGAIATGFLALSFTAHRPLVAGAIALFNWGMTQLQRLPLARRRSLPTLLVPALTRPVLLRAFLFSLVKFGATVLRLILFSQALQTPIPSQVILLGTPVGQLSYLFAFTPGGLGIFEAGWFAILTVADVAEGLITPFLVEQRVLTYLCVTLWALLSFLNSIVPRRGSPPA